MATSVAGIIGWGVSDGETIDAVSTRHSTVSAFDVVHGSSPLAVRGGIVPAGGTPLKVNSLGTAQVQLKAGRCVVTPNAAGTPPYGLTLAADTNLDVSAAHASLVRVDLVIAEIQDVGTSSALGQFRILEGTAGSGRPALPTTPSTTHCISLATITLPAGGGSTISAGWITQAQSDTWAKTDSDATWTCAPGGTVLVDFASPSSLFQMSATRRQGFAALFAPGTRWVDTVNRTEGYFDGSDIVPTTPRTLVDFYDASGVSAAALDPDLATHSSLTLIGGKRLLQLTASCIMRGTAHAGARAHVDAMQGPYLQQSVDGNTGDYYHTASRTWIFTATGAVGANAWKMQGLRDGGSGTVTFEQRTLQVVDLGPAP